MELLQYTWVSIAPREFHPSFLKRENLATEGVFFFFVFETFPPKDRPPTVKFCQVLILL